ncbi:MAG TPA: hypothetical protein VFQ00_09930 [Terriglobales bacterium]|nr:hypothetical protein [Terriglobales bacterium]
MTEPQRSRGLPLAEVNAEIEYQNSHCSTRCRVYFDLKESNPILFEPVDPLKRSWEPLEPNEIFHLTVANVPDPIECYYTHCSIRLTNEESTTLVILAPRRSLIEVDHPSPLLTVRAGVLNLGHYRFKGEMLSTFRLSEGGWHFEFAPVDDLTLQFSPLIQTEEYFFTHHLRVHKSEAQFSCAEAHSELRDICTFLSFCHGHWVSTALTYGIDKDGLAMMEEWGTRTVSPWRRTSNWLDEHHGDCMVELFPGFMRILRSSPEWRTAIQHAVYWYVRSDTNLIGPDGACILLQAALERLAWQVLVRDRRIISQDGFKKLPAADQLRLLLATVSIPLTLPGEMPQLVKAARKLNWIDGPQAFVEIRNWLVHPPKISRGTTELPFFDAFRLGKWYLELAILSVCQYRGVYSNRTRGSRWIGQVETVPWVVSAR